MNDLYEPLYEPNIVMCENCADAAGPNMEQRDPKDYLEGDLCPEHTRRETQDDKPLHPDVTAAYDYVESVLDTSDFKNSYAWHGWALREAFLAGITHDRESR